MPGTGRAELSTALDPVGQAPQAGSRTGRVAAVCSCCTSGVSVVCMTSMVAAVAGAGASAGAGAASFMASSAHAAHAAGGSSVFAALASSFDRIGLGVLNRIPNEIAQPGLAALLTLNLVAGFLAFRGHRSPFPLIATLGSSVVLYGGIYVWPSDVLYFIGVGGLLLAAALGLVQSLRRPRLRMLRVV